MSDTGDRKFGGLIDAFRRWYAKKGDAQPESKDVSEELNKALPDALSARSAILEDRRRKKMIDDQLKDAER